MNELARNRGWSFLPPQLQSFKSWSRYWTGANYIYSQRECNYRNGNFFDLSPLLSSHCNEKNRNPYITIDCVNMCNRQVLLSDFLTGTKLLFHFKHPATSKCNLLSNCGFILKTVPSQSALRRLKLCTDDEDYKDEMIHFHDEIRLDKIHLCLVVKAKDVKSEHLTLIPLSWLGWISSEEQREKWVKDYYLECHDERKYIVLYDTTA